MTTHRHGPFILDPAAGLDVSTAAAHLGIRPSALRKRIYRGSVEAWKEAGGEWRVRLPHGLPAGQPVGRPMGQDAGGPPGPAAGRDLEALEREVAWLRGQVERLMGILEQQAASRADLATCSPAVPAPAALPPPLAAPLSPVPRTTLQSWWRRALRALAEL